MFRHRNQLIVVSESSPRNTQIGVEPHRRRALTLLELTISLTITSMMSVVLLGLINAVHTAQRHSEGQQTATLQAQATFDRISYMLSQAGTYKLEDRPVRHGFAIVNRHWLGFEMPDILVVWSGGRSGGQSALGQLDRSPLASEIVVYAPDLEDPTRYFEYAFPEWTASLDFDADDFDDRIIKAIESEEGERAKLSDRVRVTSLAYSTTPQTSWPNVRFSITHTPSDAEISATDPDTADWDNLPWSQGVTTSTGGLRRSVVRMELQLEPRSYAVSDANTSIAIPFLASASTRYVYDK